jgi:hypothetical protein
MRELWPLCSENEKSIILSYLRSKFFILDLDFFQQYDKFTNGVWYTGRIWSA